jgi:hypothetical protein
MIGQNQPCLHVAHRYSNRPHSDNCKLSTRAKPCKSCSNMTPFRSDFVCLCEACMGTAQGRPATNRLPCTTLLRAHLGSAPFHSDTPATESSNETKFAKKKKKKKKKFLPPNRRAGWSLAHQLRKWRDKGKQKKRRRGQSQRVETLPQVSETASCSVKRTARDSPEDYVACIPKQADSVPGARGSSHVTCTGPSD